MVIPAEVSRLRKDFRNMHMQAQMNLEKDKTVVRNENISEK